MMQSTSLMAGSGFIAVGLGFAVVLRWLGFPEREAFNYGMIGGMLALMALGVGLVGYVVWKTLFGPDDPA